MTGDDSSHKYFARRRFYVPEDEVVRDYRRKDLTPADYLFSCDYEVLDDDED